MDLYEKYFEKYGHVSVDGFVDGYAEIMVNKMTSGGMTAGGHTQTSRVVTSTKTVGFDNGMNTGGMIAGGQTGHSEKVVVKSSKISHT